MKGQGLREASEDSARVVLLKDCTDVGTDERQEIEIGKVGESNIDQREVICIDEEETDIENERLVTGTKGAEEDLKTVTEQLNSGNPDDIISKHYLEMRRDYRSLTGKNFLNYKVIDEYLNLIQERSSRPNIPSVYAMTTHAYTWLDEDFSRNFDKVESWIKEDLENKDIILVPIHKDDHWTLIVFETKLSLITYYDSIVGTRRTTNAPTNYELFHSTVEKEREDIECKNKDR